MKPRVFVPSGMRAPTPFANRPSSLANDVCHVVADAPFESCLYSRDAPVVGSRTELMAWVRVFGMLRIAMMLAAIEYFEDALGWSVEGRMRLIRLVCWRLCRVGYR